MKDFSRVVSVACEQGSHMAGWLGWAGLGWAGLGWAGAGLVHRLLRATPQLRAQSMGQIFQ